MISPMSTMLKAFAASVLIISSTIGAVANAQDKACDTADCAKPAYELTIINHGEGKPAGANDTDENLQSNRRVDVTLTTDQEIEKVVDERRVEFETGGTVWVSQDPSSLSRLLEVTAGSGVKITDGRFNDPVKFTLGTNYADFITDWEILIWREGQSDATAPLATIKGEGIRNRQTTDWDGSNSEDYLYEEGEKLEYALRVFDKNGNADQTRRKLLAIDTNKKFLASELPLLAVFESLNDSGTDRPELAQQSITLQGSMVRVYGQGFDSSSKVLVNGDPITLNSEGKFAYDTIKEGKVAEFVVTSETNNAKPQEQILKVDLEQRYFFMVGMADLTVGENRVTGSSQVLEVDPHHYGGDIFVDGRLAFYLKGKIKGKYLLTAQMDTGTDDISNLFDDFHKKDPQSIFRRLDPDQYYPVYGDDSNLRDDTNSQGKLYVRLDWDKSWALWGNYNTGFSGAELAPFNRSLYGAQLVYRSVSNTELGDTKTQLSAFASQAQSLFRHNEFIGTGGSLYYLSDNDIVSGSEKIAVEVRREPGGRVIERIEMIAGRDYDIDYFQGRIILRRPLISIAAGGNPSIIRDEPLPGDRAWLVVDYEYAPGNVDVSDATAGIRAKQWIGDHVAVGGTWAHETREQQDYDLKGVDVTLKKADNTFIKLEAAQSTASFQSSRSVSTDGGLSFVNNTLANPAAETSGSAASIEAQYSAGDFNSDVLEKRVTAWAKQRDAEFATANHNSTADNSDLGVEAFVKPHEDWGLFAKAQRYVEKDSSRETIVSSKINYSPNDKITIATELQNTIEKDLVSNTEGTLAVGAASVSVNATDNLNLYGIQQLTVKKTGVAKDNDLTTVGAKYQVNDKFKLNAELSTGDRGDSMLLGTERWLSESYQVYSSYVLSLDADSKKKSTFVLGQRKSLSSTLKVYSEHQFSRETTNDSFAHTIGLDNRINKFTSVNLSLQAASLESEGDEAIDRTTLSAGIEYQRNKVRFTGKYEYRKDEGETTDLTQWITTNRFEYRRSVSLRWQGKLNASVTTDQEETMNAKFVEAGVGFAYRPVTNDRFNMLGRVTYLFDLQPDTPSSENDQRSIIISTEGIYDITKRWAFGGKYAHRASEIRLERATGPWVGNDASLVGVRLRRHVPFGVDVSASYRWLWSEESDGMRSGALFTVGKRVGHHLTFSTGYNFTNFDDNLANDNYDVKGWFLNLVGTY